MLPSRCAYRCCCDCIFESLDLIFQSTAKIRSSQRFVPAEVSPNKFRSHDYIVEAYLFTDKSKPPISAALSSPCPKHI